MAFIQTRRVGFGELLSESFAVLAAIRRELAIYFGIFLAVGLFSDFVGPPFDSVIGFAAFFGYFAAQYWLYRAALTSLGVSFDARYKIFSFFFMAILIGIAVSLASNFFLIPGLLLAAKWVMAPSFLVAEDRNLAEALGDGWNASNGNFGPILGAFTVMSFVWLFAFGLLLTLGALVSEAITGRVGAGAGVSGLEWMLFHIYPVLLLGLSVAAYRALADDVNADIVSVFE